MRRKRLFSTLWAGSELKNVKIFEFLCYTIWGEKRLKDKQMDVYRKPFLLIFWHHKCLGLKKNSVIPFKSKSLGKGFFQEITKFKNVLILMFLTCHQPIVYCYIWRNLEVRNLEYYKIFVYFQAAVSALLAVSPTVSVSYVKKNQNDFYVIFWKFVNSSHIK